MIARVLLALALLPLAACSDDSSPPRDGGADGPRLDRSTLEQAAADLRAGDRGPDSPKGTWWRPAPGTLWQWQLHGTLDTTVDAKMYDIDLFDQSAAVIAGLKSAGRVVICYFSAGSYEDVRPDAADFPKEVIGTKLVGWDEYWLDIRSTKVRDIMRKRLDLAKSKGCDGVEPDNVDGYQNDNGFNLTAANQLDFNTFIANEAHARGLSVGLKNDLGQIPQLLPLFDWALNEECWVNSECDKLTPFIKAGKAVFHVEYSPDVSAGEVCPDVKPLKLDTMIKNWDLDAWFERCP